jgi:hypothetical protein
MAKKFDATMFAKIKDSLAKQPTSNGSFANIMKFPAGHTYTLRLIPNLEDVEKTYFAHTVNQWKSLADGSFVSALSLQTFNEKDPIASVRYKLWKEWKDANPGVENKEYKGVIESKQQWFVNVYVIDDPSDPENNGTVKVLRCGPQLKKIIDTAMNEREDEFGPAIYDLSKDGCDFKIVAEKQGEYTTFIKSYFTTKSKFDLSEEEVEEIYTKIHDLEAIIPVKTEDELKQLLADHFFVGEEGADDVPARKEERKPLATKKPKAKAKEQPIAALDDSLDQDEDDMDEIPFNNPTASNTLDIDDLIDQLD